jgi:lipoprotein-releasing system permease protein
MLRSLPLTVGLRYSRARGHSFFVSFITWVSLLGVCVGVAALIVILSVMNGFESELRGRLLSLAAHATVLAAPGEVLNWRQDVAELRHAAGVIGAAPILDVDSMLSRGAAMSGAIVRGIDPETEASVSELGSAIREGKLTDLVPGSNRVILGRSLAYELDAAVGDRITAMIPARNGAEGELVPRIREFDVAGIFEVGLQDHDSVLALVNLADAEELHGGAGAVGVRLKFRDVMAAPVLARAAAAKLSGRETVRDWTEENAAYFRAIRIEKSMMALILMLIVAVAAFNIVATLVMVVNDKRTDIAILRTLGASPRDIRGIFITQGVLIGWLGTLFGVLLGLVISLNVTAIVAWLERVFDFHIMDPDVYYISGIPSEIHPRDIILIALASLVLTLLATIYPAIRAAHTHPAEALRYE